MIKEKLKKIHGYITLFFIFLFLQISPNLPEFKNLKSLEFEINSKKQSHENDYRWQTYISHGGSISNDPSTQIS